jgi:integrase/recombinase XerD
VLKQKFTENVPTTALKSIQECRFAEIGGVENLGFRNAPYWHSLFVSRHIGIHRPDGKTCNWTARILTKEKKYKQKCLGPALDNGKGEVSFTEAIERAFLWFQEAELKEVANEPVLTGRTSEICICPIGKIYTVGHALRDYVEWTKLSRSKGGHYNNLVLINYHIVPKFAHIPLEEFNATNLVSLAKQVLETPPKYGFMPYKPRVSLDDLSSDDIRRRKKTFNSLLSIMKMAFQHAWDSGKIESERPWRCIKRISVNHTPRTLFLTRRECKDLLEACDLPLQQLVLGALYTGCRVGELGALRVEDVGRQGFGLRVDAFKRAPARFVFLPDEGMAFFLKLCQGKSDRDYVFLSHRKLPWRRQHTPLFRRAVTKAGLPEEFVFHGLRHTYASDLVRQGVPLEVIAKQLGHANSIAVSNTYGHLAEHYREEQIRTRFSALSSEYAKDAVSEANTLNSLWSSFQGQDWRQYASVPSRNPQPLRSLGRAHPDVAKVFLI